MNFIDIQEIEEKELLIRRHLPEALLSIYPINIYIDQFKSYSIFDGYNHVDDVLNALFAEIKAKYGVPALASYHKLALLCFLRQALEDVKQKRLPSQIVRLCTEWFGRILDDVLTQPDEYYHHENDSFLKDLGVARLKAVPVGGPWISQVCRVRKTLLASDGIRQFSRLASLVLTKTKGFGPFYGLHTAVRCVASFSSKNRDLCYANVAEMLKLNTEIKGLCGESWFNDPMIRKLSPQLAYLYETPTQNGAMMFRCGTSEIAVRHATTRSPRRKKLYEEGKYIPTDFIFIWPREELIKWADNLDTRRLRETLSLQPEDQKQGSTLGL